MNDNSLYGKRVDIFRRSKGYTQQYLADLCKVSPKTIQVITKNKRKPSMPLLADLCIHLDMPVDCFITENRDGFALSREQIEKLKEMPVGLLKQLLALVRSLYDEASITSTNHE